MRTLLFGLATAFALAVSPPIPAQTPITWETLRDVRFEDAYDLETGTVYPTADFGFSVERLENAEVSIVGYLLPLDVGGDRYALSATPFSSCFFCGKGGPETVMELRLSRKEKWFEMDQLVLFKGRLLLNENDPSSLYYILDKAVAVERLDR